MAPRRREQDEDEKDMAEESESEPTTIQRREKRDEQGNIEIRDIRLGSRKTFKMKSMAVVVEAAMRVNCVRRALDEVANPMKALERAAALGAVLENLRISGNRKCHAYLLQYPKDVVSLPWEQLGGTDDWHQLPKLFAGEVWDGRS